jgi:hypothetical protein
MNYTEFNTRTGRLGGVHSSSSDDIDAVRRQIFLPDMDDLIEGSWDASIYYLIEGQPTERPASPVTIDGRTLSNVPPGSTLWIDGEQYEAEGDVELEFPLPGSYSLRVECWPYKDWEGEVVV